MEQALLKWNESPQIMAIHSLQSQMRSKNYSQDGVTYLCNRDTVNPVYNALRELVGIYVEQKGE